MAKDRPQNLIDIQLAGHTVGMTLTNKQWNLVSVAAIALLLALAIFGGGYRSVGVLFAPLGLWLSLRREPEQAEIRPAIRVLGWLYVTVAAAAFVGAVVAIAAGR